MAVQKYSKLKNGNQNISENFKVREFACKAGTDTILVSDELVDMLEKLRKKLKSNSIRIYSGYRTPEHNAKINGSKTSKHCRGLAADIIVKVNGKVLNSKYVCCMAQTLGFPGVAYISSNSTHVDVRPTGIFRVDESKGNKKVENFYTYFNGNPYKTPTAAQRKGDKGDQVRWIQYQLNRAGGHLDVDGSYGAKTYEAVKLFQKNKNLDVDGVAGKNTRKMLSEIL